MLPENTTSLETFSVMFPPLYLIVIIIDCLFCLLEDPARTKLMEFGQFVSNSMPKYVQAAQVTEGNELEVLICPEGVIPILSFLRDHTDAQFKQLIDLTAVDWPSKPFRFEVSNILFLVY